MCVELFQRSAFLKPFHLKVFKPCTVKNVKIGQRSNKVMNIHTQ